VYARYGYQKIVVMLFLFERIHRRLAFVCRGPRILVKEISPQRLCLTALSDARLLERLLTYLIKAACDEYVFAYSPT
jgi:hypothetical protein